MYVFSLLKKRFLTKSAPLNGTTFAQTVNDNEDYSENYNHTRTNPRVGRKFSVLPVSCELQV